MKKVLALVLAVVMVLGTCTMAMAASKNYGLSFTKDSLDLSAAVYAKDGKVDATNVVPTTGAQVPGKTIYFPLTGVELDSTGKATATELTKLSQMSNFKIGYTINDGKNMVESVKFATLKDSGVSEMYLAVALKDNYILESQDIDLDVKITAVNGNKIAADATALVATDDATTKNIAVTANLVTTAGYTLKEVTGNGYVTITGSTVLNFADDADDVTLVFDKDVEVQGKMKGQKDVQVTLKTANDTLEEKYPNATLRLFPSTKDTFKREVTVTMGYTADGDKAYIYEVDAKGNLTAVKDAKFADEKFTFKTTTLGNYVLSDKELKTVAAAGDSTTEKNPETGANDFVGLAVAMAVVAVAGIAVAKKK